jgi:hypothetical protein
MTPDEAIEMVNTRLRPARITASIDGDLVKFVHQRTTAAETIETVVKAAEFASNAKLDLPTAPYVKGVYEQFLTRPSLAVRAPVRAVQPLASQDGSVVCFLGRPTLGFVLAVLGGDPTMPLRALVGVGFGMSSRRLDVEYGSRFADAFLSGYTIRVEDKTLKLPVTELPKIANSSLFNFAFGQALTWVPARSWVPVIRLNRHSRREEVQFPRRIYNQDLIAYYQLAISSESALLAYLSLYNVLEYFFSAATEHAMHSKLKDLLVQPDFVHTKPKKLRELVKLIRTHDQKHNELAALRLVIESKLDCADVIDWITNFEAEEGKWFTDGASLFGETVPIQLTADQFSSSLAKRIYHLRCLLVHNKEAEKSRYLPFSADDDLIRRELPLLLFLAEKLIISSGSELNLSH